MCTVSFIPTRGKVFITSNRDENGKRPLAFPPAMQKLKHCQIISPKDPLAGGTWIATKDDATAMVMLNGAFVKHLPQPPYRTSRGQIFRDVFCKDDSLETFGHIHLQGIEPFTLVLWQKGFLHQMQWDGKVKYILKKDPLLSHIWSSCTLYTPHDIAYRETFFKSWIAKQNNISKDDILKFHLYTDGAGNAEKNIRINRDGKMLTVSVSCIEMEKGNTDFYYSDLIQEKTSHCNYENYTMV